MPKASKRIGEISTYDEIPRFRSSSFTRNDKNEFCNTHANGNPSFCFYAITECPDSSRSVLVSGDRCPSEIRWSSVNNSPELCDEFLVDGMDGVSLLGNIDNDHRTTIQTCHATTLTLDLSFGYVCITILLLKGLQGGLQNTAQIACQRSHKAATTMPNHR